MYSRCLSVKNVPNWLFSVRMLQIHQKDPLGFNYPVYVEEEESLRKTLLFVISQFNLFTFCYFIAYYTSELVKINFS